MISNLMNNFLCSLIKCSFGSDCSQATWPCCCASSSCCQLASKMVFAQFNCKMPALFPGHLLFWYSIIILCMLQRRGEKQLFHQDLFYFCSVSFISFHWPAVRLYSHIKVTFATPFPPKSPTPPFSLRPVWERRGLLQIFSRQKYNTWHVEQFSNNNGNKNFSADVAANLGLISAVRH